MIYYLSDAHVKKYKTEFVEVQLVDVKRLVPPEVLPELGADSHLYRVYLTESQLCTAGAQSTGPSGGTSTYSMKVAPSVGDVIIHSLTKYGVLAVLGSASLMGEKTSQLIVSKLPTYSFCKPREFSRTGSSY